LLRLRASLFVAARPSISPSRRRVVPAVPFDVTGYSGNTSANCSAEYPPRRGVITSLARAPPAPATPTAAQVRSPRRFTSTRPENTSRACSRSRSAGFAAAVSRRITSGESTYNFVGYFYLPRRDPNNINYAPAGFSEGKQWVFKKRIGGKYSNAPIMSDMKQSFNGRFSGVAGSVPYSSHRDRRTQEPRGGNFLFEDGRVEWRDTSEIQVGATIGGWQFWYRISVQ
jgi:hypothetical protein